MLKRIFILILIGLMGGASTSWAIKYKGELETNQAVEFPEQSSAPANAVWQWQRELVNAGITVDEALKVGQGGGHGGLLQHEL